jgi:hypothetical protein
VEENEVKSGLRGAIQHLNNWIPRITGKLLSLTDISSPPVVTRSPSIFLYFFRKKVMNNGLKSGRTERMSGI